MNLGQLPIAKGNYKVQTLLVDRAIGEVAGTYDIDIEFDGSYDRVIGIALNEITTGTQTYYRVGLDDDQGRAINELVHKNMFQTTSAVPQDQKWQLINFQIVKGAKFNIKVQHPATIATSNLTFELAFILFRDTNPNG